MDAVVAKCWNDWGVCGKCKMLILWKHWLKMWEKERKGKSWGEEYGQHVKIVTGMRWRLEDVVMSRKALMYVVVLLLIEAQQVLEDEEHCLEMWDEEKGDNTWKTVTRESCGFKERFVDREMWLDAVGLEETKYWKMRSSDWKFEKRKRDNALMRMSCVLEETVWT